MKTTTLGTKYTKGAKYSLISDRDTAIMENLDKLKKLINDEYEQTLNGERK